MGKIDGFNFIMDRLEKNQISLSNYDAIELVIAVIKKNNKCTDDYKAIADCIFLLEEEDNKVR